MEAKLDFLEMDLYSPVYGTTINREETIETVVPDTLPDIGTLLGADSVVYLRSKNIQNGKVVVEASLQGTVLYQGEGDTQIFRLDLQQMVYFTMEEEAVRESDKLLVRLQVNHTDARTLNPRKVLLRADVSAKPEVYRADKCRVAHSVEENSQLQTLIKTASAESIASVGEKTFAVSDEFTIPTAKGAMTELLYAKASAAADELKPVGGKMILQGTTVLKVGYLSDNRSQPLEEEFSISFSQILDRPEDADGLDSVVLMPTACYVEPTFGQDSGGISMELHLTAQYLCRKKMEIPYIADVYSTRVPCRVEEEEKVFASEGRTASWKETLRDMIETPEAVREVLTSRVDLGSPVKNEGEFIIPVGVHALCRTENESLCYVSRRMKAAFGVGLGEDALVLHTECMCSDPYFSPASGGVELRLPLELKALIQNRETHKVVTGVELEETAPPEWAEGPSVTVVRCGETNLWELAKRYRTTCDLIEKANPDCVEKGKLLLIPRMR